MQMRTCPSRYRPYLEAELERVLQAIRLDVTLREDEDARIRNLASVPDLLINADATGTLTIVVGVNDHERQEQAAA